MTKTITVSPLRQRMLEDMVARVLKPGTQRGYIRGCLRFAAFLKRSPETATTEDVRLFQLHLVESGARLRTAIPSEAVTGWGARVKTRRIGSDIQFQARSGSVLARRRPRPTFGEVVR